MRVEVRDRDPRQIVADALVIVFRAPQDPDGDPDDEGASSGPAPLTLPLAAHLRPDAAELVVRAAEGQTWLETRDLPTPRVLLHCLGPEPEAWDPEAEYLGGHAGSLDRAGVALAERRLARNAGAQIERACLAAGVERVALAAWPPDLDVELLVEGACLRAHDPRAWEAQDVNADVNADARVLEVCVPAKPRPRSRRLAARVRETVALVAATNFARTLADLPGNLGTAADIVARVRAELDASGVGLELSTISAAKARALGMGLFTAVDAGAATRGCILRLDHRPDLDDAPVVFVGKGLTHDTGGYNLKRGPSIQHLTYDKGGASAVIGAMLAIARLDLPVRITALCPLTENLIGAHAYKPGDVLRACDGTSVYVENTDAEGRLVLADVLAWLRVHGPTPELVVDLATLTGETHAALGEPFAALYCNEDRARDLLVAAGERTGDLVWPMPIHDLHDRDLGHHKADLRNVGAGPGAPSSAAAFLRAFVDYPWAHVDLAGKARAPFARGCHGPGATGFGCRLLVELARRLAA